MATVPDYECRNGSRIASSEQFAACKFHSLCGERPV